MKKFTKLTLILAMLFGIVGGVSSQDYQILGGESQNGWSWGFSAASPTSGVVGYKLTSKWATFGLMGGYDEISVADYPNWKVYFEGKSPSNCQLTYKIDGSDKYVGGGGQSVASGTFDGTSVTGFYVQCTSEDGCVVVVRDVVFYKDDEATGIHPSYVAPGWGGSCITNTLSFTNKYGAVYAVGLDNAVNKKVTVTAGSAIPDGINLYYRINGSSGPEKWVSLSGKTEHSETIVGTIYAICIQCGTDASNESPIVAENVTLYSEDLPTVTYAAPVSETSINTLTYYSSGSPKSPVWNMNVNESTIYGNGNTAANSEYVDLDEYDELRIYQTAGDPVRVFMWNADMSGTVTINTSSTPVKLTLVDDYYKLDISSVKANYTHAYLNAIKASAYNTTANVSALTVTSVSDGVNCILKGDATYGLLSAEATAALDNADYTAIDVSRIKNGSELTLTPANPNCLFITNSATIANTNNVIVSDVCASLELTDGKPFKAPAGFTATSAKFTKTVSDAGYATMVIPFTAALPSGVTAKELTGVSGETITASDAASIAADEPVLIKADAGDYEFTATDAAIAATADGEVTNGLLKGSYAGTTATADGTNYVLQKNGSEVNFYKVTGTAATVKPFRAYLSVPSPAPVLYFNFFDMETTGLNDVRGKMADVRGDFFDLQGRKVANPTKGLYIVNGKKVMVK